MSPIAAVMLAQPALLAVLFLPGLAVLAMLGHRSLTAVAIAPAVSGLLVAGAGVVLSVLGVPWRWWSFAVFCLASLAVLLGWAWGRHRRLTCPRLPVFPAPLGVTGALGLAVVLAVAWLVQALQAVTAIPPNLPVQSWDPVFHVNAAWTIVRTGDASMFGGLAPMYGLSGQEIFYPTVWHSFLALVMNPVHTVAWTNALSLALFWVWGIGLAALARVALPRMRSAVYVIVALATLQVAFPAVLVTLQPSYPNALAVAMLPGVWAAAIETIALMRVHGWQGHQAEIIRLSIISLAGLLGASVTHPSAIFSTVLLFLPGAVLALRWWYRHRLDLGVPRQTLNRHVVLGTLAVVAALGALTLTPQVRSLINQLKPTTRADFPTVVLQAIRLWPTEAGHLEFSIAMSWIIITSIIGVVWSRRFNHTWWISGGWFLIIMVASATYVYLGPLTWIASLWNGSIHRLLAVAATPVLLLATAGTLWLAHRVQQFTTRTWAAFTRGEKTNWEEYILEAGYPKDRPPHSRLTLMRVLASCLAVCLVAVLTVTPTAAGLYKRFQSPRAQSGTVMATWDELAMLQRLPAKLPANAFVLGDPMAGAAFVQAIGQRRAVFPQLAYYLTDTDGQYLRNHFNEILTDPKVCEVVNRRGITHYYAAPATTYAGAPTAEHSPGLYSVPTNRGFEAVDTDGSTTVYRITACDPGFSPSAQK